MKDINIRFKKLRKATKKSQEEFGKVVGIKKSGISNIENGLRDVTEQHIKFILLWKDYHVSEDWLRFGTGNMFLEMNRNDQIVSWASKITRSENDKTFANRFAYLLSELDEEDWIALEKFAKLLAKVQTD
ncbi:helix-turn-helix domain-containing protein [Anaeromicropila populeti]|uniref:Helix-turn-helix n=1 Tax=Anaeromicropila populeti TaxID=37658 RepID=A0A1I6LX15_9FIRM|nr:helix-turn-helix transcriptional regulator [Anaeromicropila populeti]SFS07950.1 Helix-turn-helix [Anaeromicropila populeti]